VSLTNGGAWARDVRLSGRAARSSTSGRAPLAPKARGCRAPVPRDHRPASEALRSLRSTQRLSAHWRTLGRDETLPADTVLGARRAVNALAPAPPAAPTDPQQQLSCSRHLRSPPAEQPHHLASPPRPLLRDLPVLPGWLESPPRPAPRAAHLSLGPFRVVPGAVRSNVSAAGTDLAYDDGFLSV
jgi:hypothetical protein